MYVYNLNIILKNRRIDINCTNASIFAFEFSNKLFNIKTIHSMKKILSSSLLLVLALSATAAPRTMKQKKSAALSALCRIGNNGARPMRAPLNAELKTLDASDAYTILGYEDGGFAIIANDDRNEAIVGYSDAAYQSANLPDGMKWYLAALNEALDNTDATRYTFMPKLEQAGGVAPLMECEWGQSAPFNNLVPHSYPTGCVATAMAQIFYTNKYPESGQGKKFDSNTRKMIDFSTFTYDYSSMLPSYGGKYSNTQAKAVAQLMYHCGLAANMDYNASGSGTGVDDARSASIDYFKYNANANVHYRYVRHLEDWMDLIYSEIDAKRPILFGASDKNGTGGHAFVFDGYNSDGLVHVNWGWDGDCNGYYDMSLLNPTDSYNNKYQYSQGQAMLTGLGKPTDDIIRVSEIITKDNFTLTYANGEVSCPAFSFYNHNYYDFNGVWFLVLAGVTNPDYFEAITGYSFEKNPIAGIDEEGRMKGINLGAYSAKLPKGLPDGVYLIYNCVQDNGSNYVNLITAPDGVNQYYTLEKKGTSITLSEGVVTTGVSSVVAGANKKLDSSVYSIDGHKLSGSLDVQPSGLYIVNGKKVIK